MKRYSILTITYNFEMGATMRQFIGFLVLSLFMFAAPSLLVAEPAQKRGQPMAVNEDIHFLFGQAVAMPPVLQAVTDECARVPMYQEFFNLFSKHLLAEGTRKVDLVGKIHIDLMTVQHGEQEAAGFVKLIEQVKVDSYAKLQNQIMGFTESQKEAACGKWREILLARDQFNIDDFIAKYMRVLKKKEWDFFEKRQENFVLMGLLPEGIKVPVEQTIAPSR